MNGLGRQPLPAAVSHDLSSQRFNSQLARTLDPTSQLAHASLPRTRALGHISRVTDTPLWSPSAEAIEAANVTRFIRDAVQPLGGAAAEVADARSLWRWSVAQPADFW